MAVCCSCKLKYVSRALSGGLAFSLTALTIVHAQASARRLPVPGAPVGVTAFVDVAVVPMDTERVLSNQTVLIEGGWITALGPSSKITVPTKAMRIDGRGKYLIPGLADMHMHLGQAQFDSVNAERLMFLYLGQGVTTVRNMNSERRSFPQLRMEQILQLKARAAGGEIWSPRIYTSGAWWPERLERWWSVRQSPPKPKIQPESVATYLAAYQAAGFDHVKLYKEHGELLDSVTAAAHRLGIPIEGHLIMEEGMTVGQVLTRYRYHSVEHAIWYELDNYGSTDSAQQQAFAEVTQRLGTWVTPTLSVHGFSKRIVKTLHNAKVNLLLGTDAPSLGIAPGASVHNELALLVRAGLTPYEALLTGTRNVAAFYSTLDSTGTVAVGKRADLVLISGNPLLDIAYTADRAGVMIGGRWVPRTQIDDRFAEIAAVMERAKNTPKPRGNNQEEALPSP